MSTTRIDYVLVETTGVTWAGALPWRGPDSREGYETAEEAHARAVVIQTAYAARYGGTGGPVLRVQEREHQGRRAA